MTDRHPSGSVTRLRELVEALKPLVNFIEKFDAKPLNTVADEFYAIHGGDSLEFGASLRLSDFRRVAAALAPAVVPSVDNGNIFVFCDYVDEKHLGCVRGAGHNGPHALCLPPYPQGPVILRESATPPVVAPVAAPLEIAAHYQCSYCGGDSRLCKCIQHLEAVAAPVQEKEIPLSHTWSDIGPQPRWDAYEAPDRERVIGICQRIGFGRVMQIAADAWRERDPVGALTVGPCIAQLPSPSLPLTGGRAGLEKEK